MAVEKELAGVHGGPGRKASKLGYAVAIAGIVATVAIAIAVIYFREAVQQLEGYGTLGAFLISLLGGSTIIVPVPMLAVILALGGVVSHPWLIGLAAGLGETLGALIIYMTGRGWGGAIYVQRPSKLQSGLDRVTELVRRRGTLTLFLLSAILNPFFYPAALAAGALRFGVLKYFLICWTGKTIKGLTVAYAGYFGLRGLLRALGLPL